MYAKNMDNAGRKFSYACW